MHTKNPIFEDMSRVVTGAMGAAQAAGDELKELARAQADRLVSEMDLAPREEVDAVKELLRQALERIENLEARISDLEKG